MQFSSDIPVQFACYRITQSNVAHIAAQDFVTPFDRSIETIKKASQLARPVCLVVDQCVFHQDPDRIFLYIAKPSFFTFLFMAICWLTYRVLRRFSSF